MLKENHLGREKSPYLRQHRHNPVDWFPWCEEAFAKARAERKLLFLSIGYSTCYWCHVMEKESFEDTEVGAFLNEHFICIKVDREEHPDVDDIYMDAVMAITGRGGWPMSVFLTPELKPIWGGTYFPKAQFLDITNRLSSIWRDRPEEILANGEKLFSYLQERDQQTTTAALQDSAMPRAIARWKQNYDSVYGGFGQAPKFPPSLALRVLLRNSSDATLLPMVEHTLDRMAGGGIFDQIGGGFHRYSTDESWLAPHFEKMLYDNALLAYAYAEAFCATKKPAYAKVLREILSYVARDLRSEGGGFYSAEDAGDVGKEGEFYVWTYAELEKVLTPQELISACEMLGVREGGNFEHGTNILHLTEPVLLSRRSEPAFQSLQIKLLSIRSKRIRPQLDTKILCSWNGLMIGAYAKAYQSLGDQEYLEIANAAAHFIQTKLWHAGTGLQRRYCDGESKYAGALADYAYLIQGLLDLYEAGFEEKWLLWARELQTMQDKQFSSDDGAYFTARRDEKNLIVRKKDESDGALPSGNAVSLGNLFRLGHLFQDAQLYLQAKELLRYLDPGLARSPTGYAQVFLSKEFEHAQEIVLLGNQVDIKAAKELLRGQFLLAKIIASSSAEQSSIPLFAGKALGSELGVYICEQGQCVAPQFGIDALKKVLASNV